MTADSLKLHGGGRTSMKRVITNEYEAWCENNGCEEERSEVGKSNAVRHWADYHIQKHPDHKVKIMHTTVRLYKNGDTHG